MYQKRRRKQNHSLHYLVAFLLVSVTGVILSLTVLFNIEEIVIDGKSNYGADQIIATSGLHVGDNLFRIPKDKIQQEILSRMVYIEEVNIHRQLPNTLVIEVTPAKPSANIATDTGWLLISSTGKILDKSQNPYADLPQLVGVNPSYDIPGTKLTSNDVGKDKTVTSLLAAMMSLNFNIDVADLSDRFNVRALYDNRLTLELGAPADIKDKLAYMQKVIDQGVGNSWQGTLYWRGNREVSYLDKRDNEQYGNSYAMMDIAGVANTLSQELTNSQDTSGNNIDENTKKNKAETETKANSQTQPMLAVETVAITTPNLQLQTTPKPGAHTEPVTVTDENKSQTEETTPPLSIDDEIGGNDLDLVPEDYDGQDLTPEKNTADAPTPFAVFADDNAGNDEDIYDHSPSDPLSPIKPSQPRSNSPILEGTPANDPYNDDSDNKSNDLIDEPVNTNPPSKSPIVTEATSPGTERKSPIVLVE